MAIFMMLAQKVQDTRAGRLGSSNIGYRPREELAPEILPTRHGHSEAAHGSKNNDLRRHL
jgi:hypothetical protein